jgi:hypothetical protein
MRYNKDLQRNENIEKSRKVLSAMKQHVIAIQGFRV